MPDFPHMKENAFPHYDSATGGVDVYKYKNEIDYARYDDAQMHVMVCTVPWDMGEAHVGNRTISGIGNVVYFGDIETRDAWFDAIDDEHCFRWSTKSKELHRDNVLTVPLPFDVASRYNYVRVDYELFANSNSPVEYEDETGLRSWFWFIREVEFVSPNTTRLHLLNDAWQTFIYDIDIPYMQLERGHAPLFASDVDDYLNNPLANSEYLLTPDVRLDDSPQKVKTLTPLVFDDNEMMAVFVSSGYASAYYNWGTVHQNDWRTRARYSYRQDGSPGYYQIALPASDYDGFLAAVEEQCPQYKQTVACVYLCAAKLLELTSETQFCGYTVYRLSGSQREEDLFKLDKEYFAYPARYANLAKLYTMPYAHIEVSDETGTTHVIRIEELSGNIVTAQYALNTAFPQLNLYACLRGIGEGTDYQISFKNINDRSMTIGGRTIEFNFDWAIPTFGVFLDPAVENDYSEYFERQQAENDYEFAHFSEEMRIAYRQDTANASAKTHQLNAKATAQAQYDNAENSATTSETNANNSSLMAYNNSVDSANTTQANTKRSAKAAYDNSRATFQGNHEVTVEHLDAIRDEKEYNAEMQAHNLVYNFRKLDNDTDRSIVLTGVQTSLQNEQTFATTFTSGMGSVAAGAVSGAAMGSAGGPVGAAAGAAVGASTGLISLAASSVSLPIIISNNSTVANANINAMAGAANDTMAASKSQLESVYGLTVSGDYYNPTHTVSGNYRNGYEYKIALRQWQYEKYIADKFNLESAISSGGGINYANADRTKTAADTNANAVQSTDTANAGRTQQTTNLNASNTKITDIANARNTNQTAQGNADTTYTTETGNAKRVHDDDTTINNNRRTNAIAAVDNRQRQQRLRAPFEFGTWGNASNANVKPKMLVPRIVTDSPAGIAYAGDAFLRYGYALGRMWEFDGNWNVGERFTYWQISDMTVRGLNVPDMYMDKIRFFLFGGVTVWRNPEDIGRYSIYENGV